MSKNIEPAVPSGSLPSKDWAKGWAHGWNDGYAKGAALTRREGAQISDTVALDAIQEMLRDPEWGVGMLEDIADIVRATGRTVEDYPDGRSTWDRH